MFVLPLWVGLLITAILLYSLQYEVISAPDAWIWCNCFLFQYCTSPEFSQISTSTVHAELNKRQLFKPLMFVIILKTSFFSLAIPMVSLLGKKLKNLKVNYTEIRLAHHLFDITHKKNNLSFISVPHWNDLQGKEKRLKRSSSYADA